MSLKTQSESSDFCLWKAVWGKTGIKYFMCGEHWDADVGQNGNKIFHVGTGKKWDADVRQNGNKIFHVRNIDTPMWGKTGH